MVDFQGSINKMLNTSAAFHYLKKDIDIRDAKQAYSKSQHSAEDLLEDGGVSQQDRQDFAKHMDDMMSDVYGEPSNSKDAKAFKRMANLPEKVANAILDDRDKQAQLAAPPEQKFLSASKDDIGKQSEAMAKSTNQIDAKLAQSQSFEVLKSNVRSGASVRILNSNAIAHKDPRIARNQIDRAKRKHLKQHPEMKQGGTN